MATKREGLEAALAHAEAALARIVIKAMESSAVWVAVNFKLDKVCTLCRQLRAALVELDHSKLTANIENARDYCREVRTVLLELNNSATIPFYCDEQSCALLRSPRTTCWRNHLESMIAAYRPSISPDPLPSVQVQIPAQATYLSERNASTQKASSKVVLARSRLLRQTVGFLALVLAYLKYHHIEVQLEILKLPSIFSFPLQ